MVIQWSSQLDDHPRLTNVGDSGHPRFQLPKICALKQDLLPVPKRYLPRSTRPAPVTLFCRRRVTMSGSTPLGRDVSWWIFSLHHLWGLALLSDFGFGGQEWQTFLILSLVKHPQGDGAADHLERGGRTWALHALYKEL